MMGIVRIDYALFLFSDDDQYITHCVNDLIHAILEEEKLKQLGYNLDDYYCD